MSRRAIPPKWIRDQLPKQCCNCGATDNLAYHHIVPDVLGGKTIPSNIAVVCEDCHNLIHYGKKGAICHGDLVRKGQGKAREQGKVPGKRPADYENVMRLIAKHSTQFNNVHDLDFDMKTESEIMEMAGVKGVCYAKCKNMLKEAMNAPEWPYEWDKPMECKGMPLYDRVIKRIRC